ncbi:MAG TPA: hypothetical protein PLW77_07425, partial [Bacteroidales bacterium]|nr:hypothetical protein [Bacteroidales bacterium]HQB21919.1 hypothetical protein [Bacteroidales bacterium]
EYGFFCSLFEGLINLFDYSDTELVEVCLFDLFVNDPLAGPKFFEIWLYIMNYLIRSLGFSFAELVLRTSVVIRVYLQSLSISVVGASDMGVWVS